MSFQQSFVYCQICHQRWHQQEPLHLTSCAHILCKKHLQNYNNRSICAVCSNENISSLVLNDERSLPDDVKLFFQPLPNFIETLHQITQFQFNNLMNQVQYYQSNCIKLREKIARQQQLLYQAKQELDTIPQLKLEITHLETLLRNKEEMLGNNSNISQLSSLYNNNINSNNKSGKFFQLKNNSNNRLVGNINSNRIIPAKPMTVDLTEDHDNDDDDDNETFVTKLRNANTLKQGHLPLKMDRARTIDIHNHKSQQMLSTNHYPNDQVTPVRQMYKDNNKNGLLLNQIMADSTHINRKSVKRSKNANESSSPSLIHTSSGARSSSKIMIGLPQDKNHDSYILTPPTVIENNKLKTSRMHFPTPLEKLRINKRNKTTTTTDRLQNINPLSKRSNSQMASSNRNNSNTNHSQKAFRSIK